MFSTEAIASDLILEDRPDDHFPHGSVCDQLSGYPAWRFNSF